jgi:hypothetical protein
MRYSKDGMGWQGGVATRYPDRPERGIESVTTYVPCLLLAWRLVC